MPFTWWTNPAEAGAYPLAIQKGEGEASGALRLEGADLIRAVVAEQKAGIGIATIAARFHNGLARAIVEACVAVRDDRGLATVALSGGVFQNLLLLERTLAGLEAGGFRVLVHERVPPNDGGISLGQAAVAGARDRARIPGRSRAP